MIPSPLSSLILTFTGMRIRRSSPVPSPATSSVLALFILTFLTTVLCSPHSSSTPALSLAQRRQNAQNAPRASKPFLLRVMPLGASITVGYQSSDGNGYRKFLREQLRFAGWEVDMVGSLANGTMKDNVRFTISTKALTMEGWWC